MRQSGALCVSIMHCDLAVIIRQTAAPSMQMLSSLSPAGLDGFRGHSDNRAKHWITTKNTREGKCQEDVTDINVRQCYRCHLESENTHLDLLWKYLVSLLEQLLSFFWSSLFFRISLWNIYLAFWHLIQKVLTSTNPSRSGPQSFVTHCSVGCGPPYTLITSHHYTTSCQIKTF